MKKLIALAIVLFFSSFCAQKGEKVEKIMEDGVEVVINHIEPYKIKGRVASLILGEEFTIDLARDDMAERGLADATQFDIDSEGNIYFASSRTTENCIHKFDRNGNYINSFGRKGQGPGEVQFILYFGVDNQDNIIISGNRNKKIVIFSKEGKFVDETRFPLNTIAIFPLGNGNYFYYGNRLEKKEITDNYVPMVFSLYNSEFEEIIELDRYNNPNPLSKGFRGVNINPIFIWKISESNIYIGNEFRDYEILKYDFDGNLQQKIRKNYVPVKVPEELIKKRKKSYEKAELKVWFPENWTPFCSFFPDDEGRLYVKTFEEGDNSGEYIYDIFNSDGIFICRKSLNIYSWGEMEVCAKAKRERLYCLQEKKSGYRKLVVYKMKWD